MIPFLARFVYKYGGTELPETKKPVFRPLKSILTLALWLFNFIAIAQTPDANGIIYVTPTGNGNGNGSSWPHATSNLQGAINSGATKVFVAIGSYSAQYLAMKDNVAIYGGFDPVSGIVALSQSRILPNANAVTLQGSVLLGNGEVSVVRNNSVSGTAVLDGFTITGGSAIGTPNTINDDGGGILNISSSPTLKNLLIQGNHANGSGGGISNFNTSSPVMLHVVIKGNTANRGGGVNNDLYSYPKITNSVIRENTATEGGGVYNVTDASSPMYIGNTLIADNTATSGGGIYLVQGYLEMTNVTIAGNTSGAIHENSGYQYIYNSIIYGGVSGGSGSYQTSLVEGVNANGLSLSDVFANPSTGDYGLKSSSPAVNAGNNGLFTNLDANTKDLAGNARVYNYVNNGIIDLGAYEFQDNPILPDANAIVYVKPTAAGFGTGTDWNNATANLQGAINSGATKVFVAKGEYKVSDNDDNSFIMKNGVAIYGGFDPENNITDLTHKRIMPNPTGTQGTVLDGQNTRPVIWNVLTSATAMDNTAILDGFAITKGAYPNGGGIRNVYASPTLNNVVVTGNSATATGAGIYNENSSPVITNAVISSNIIINLSVSPIGNAYGAGMYNTNSSAPVLTNTTVTGNILQALGATGGAGVYNTNSSTPKIYNSIVWNNFKMANTATSGADIENNSATVTLKNSITQSYTTGNPADNNKVNTNPLFVSTADLSLPLASPAIDAGDNAWLSPYGGVGGADLAGNPRLTGSSVDMGAYEFTVKPDVNGIVYVRENALGFGNGLNWANATSNLQAAIDARGTQKVLVAVGNYPVGSSSFMMKNGVSIYGGFDPDRGIDDLGDSRILPDKNTIAGSVLNGQNTRPVIWNVFSEANVMDTTAVLDGFTIMEGKNNGDGGGFHNEYASPTLSNLVIRNNSAINGGGIYNFHSSPMITQVVVTANTASTSAGGIQNSYSYPILTNVAITGNSAGFLGGGMANGFYSSPTLTNVLIAQNTAVTNGGGIYNGSAKGILSNVTITGNSPNAIAYRTDQINNSIIFGQMDGGTPVIQNSLIPNNSDVSNGNLYSIGIAPVDVFTNPSAGDYTLKSTSPAINAGRNTLFADLNENSKDLKANPRVHDFVNGGVIDLGAYESLYETPIFGPDSQGVLYVKETGTGNESGDNWDNATGSLRRAIHSNGVKQVWVAVGNYEMDEMSLMMKNGVAIYGGFDPDNHIRTLDNARILPKTGTNMEGTVLNGLDERPVVWNVLTSSTAMNNTAVLDGFTITGGKSNTGGGIYNHYASPTLTNLWIKGNAAALDGGGIHNVNSSSPVMTSVTVANNTASYGGGIFNRNSSSSVMTNVVVKDNTSINDGGGMYNDAASSPVLTNVAITGNTAKNGAGIYNRTNSSPVLVNVQLTDNAATNHGGAMRNETSSSPILTNVTIAGNGASNALYATGGTISLFNAIVYGGITGSYVAQHALIEGNTNTANNNLNATGITPPLIFTNPSGGAYTLQSCSPAINAGDNNLTPSGTATDIAGAARIQLGTVDLGAYEAASNTPGQSATLVTEPLSITRTLDNEESTVFANDCATLVATVNNAGGYTVAGSVTARVWIEDLQPAQYVKRHYEITPANNAETATGQVTLYFSQEEFDAFNASNTVKLPTDAGDSQGIARLMIEKRGGSSTDDSGLPNTYPGSVQTIGFQYLHVVWNAVNARWEISFDVTGFSGFFVKTIDSPLPVRWISFTARLSDDSHGVLDWKVDQTNVLSYQIERSSNARDFSVVAALPATSGGGAQYSFTDPLAAIGTVYYRIRQTDLDGTYSYSKVVSVSAPEYKMFRAYPNPVGNLVTVEVGAEYVGSRINLVNVSGVLLQSFIVKEPILTIDFLHHSSGTYLLHTHDGKVVKLFKE